MHDKLLVLEQLEEDNLLFVDQMARKTQLMHDLIKINEEEELYWFKRLREKWVLEGDNSTEFFRRVANRRKRRNTIISLEDGSNTIEGDDNLLAHATEYYKNLFGPAPGNLPQ
jgi:DNA-binding PadR family transcriptional regulator